MTSAARPNPASSVLLLAGPAIFAVGIVLGYVSNEMIWIGPIDRATFGWAVVVPMCLVAPVLSGIAARWTGERAALAISWIAAAGVAIFFIVSLALSIGQIGCTPVSDRSVVAAQAAPIGIAAGLGYGAAAWAAARLRAQPWRSVVAGLVIAMAGGVGALFAFAAQFPGVSCVPVPG